MGDCPELSAIEDARDPAVAGHVAQCASCRVVVELLAERRREVDARDRRDECALFEMLLAAREAGTIAGSAGTLLDEHLRECADCQVVAATMPPPNDRRDASSLPAVSTAAYALGREVARGGMGRILDAEDTRIGRRVAVKELLGRSPALAARFEREARVTARLQHPGIVPIYEIGKWPDGTPFYAMRMVEGRTLRDAIRDLTTIEARLALLPAVIAAAEAVAFAHGKLVIHRDLTPSNILVGEYGDTVVIDWGLAKDLSASASDDAADPYRDPAASDGGLTHVGAVLGTAAYMPPEQARGESVDERADVYALGAILYHLLAGAPPYRGTSSEEVVRAVQEGPPRAIATEARGTPRDLVSIVEKAMARDPDDRYPTARELVEELRRYRTGRLVEAHRYSTAERLRRWMRAHRAVVVASAAAFVAIAVAGSIGVVGVMRERNRAEVARAKAESENAMLMEEQGRQELLAGNTTRAVTWLGEAYKAGDASPELRFLLGTAMRQLEAIAHTEECVGRVQSIEFSPDGSHVMAACAFGIGTARVSDWKRDVTIAAHADGATYSPDGLMIASWDYNRVSLWSALTGAHLLGPIELGGRARNVHFTPDNKTLVSSSDDGMLQAWNVASGLPLLSLHAQSGAMNVVRFNITPDGSQIVSMTSDGLYQVWSVTTGERVRSFKVSAQPIGSENMLSPDGSKVISCTTEGSVSIIELSTGRTLSMFPAHAQVSVECAYSRDGRVILTTGMDGMARVWEAATGRLLSTLPHGGVAVHGMLSPDGERVATIGGGGTVKVWHAASGTLLAAFDDPFGGFQERVTYSPDGRTLVMTRKPSTIVAIRDLDGGQRPLPLAPGTSAEGASPDLERLVIAAEDGTLTLIDSSTMRPLTHPSIRKPFAFSHNSNRLAATTSDGVLVLDARTGQTIALIRKDAPEMVALDDVGRRLLLAGPDATVWDVDTQTQVLELHRYADKDCLSPAGDVVIAWKDPREIEIWNIEQRAVQARIGLTRETLGPVGFDASGRRVIVIEKEDPTAHADEFALGVLGLYDVRTGAKEADLGRSILPSLDQQRRYLVTFAQDGRFVVRDATTGARLSEVVAGGGAANGQALADGALMAVGDLETLALRSAKDGRLLGALRSVLHLVVTQDSFQAGNPQVVIRGDGRALVQLGRHPVQWTLPREERSADEIDRIIRSKVRWQIVDGRLVAATSTLHGRVVRRGMPVGAAEVSLESGTGGWLHTLSAADGTFEFPNLPNGHYGVIVFASDHSAKGMHDVMMGQGDLGRDFEIDEDATVAGFVVDELGQPVAGVEIQAGLGEGALRGRSDATGAFTIRALGLGQFELHVVRANAGVPTGFTSAAPVKVTVPAKDARIKDVTVVARREARMP